MNDKLFCGYCGRGERFTAPVSVTLVFMAALPKPYPLIPAQDYRLCRACRAIYTFVDKAVAAHSVTRNAGGWTRAVVLFQDGRGFDVKPKHPPQPMALA